MSVEACVGGVVSWFNLSLYMHVKYWFGLMTLYGFDNTRLSRYNVPLRFTSASRRCFSPRHPDTVYPINVGTP